MGDKSAQQVSQSGSAWVTSGAFLAIGAALPALAFKHYFVEIAASTPDTRTLIVLAEDALFMVFATLFLMAGEQFGRQRHPQAAPYPGPFTEVDGRRMPPAFFKAYVFGLPLVLGMLLPILAGIYLASVGQLNLAASTMGLYLMTLVAQQLSEGWFLRRQSTMWGQVPHAYQIYRVWQLARGCWLTSVVGGPDWLQLLQESLILLWVFNFGAVMTWTPWLHRWHMQPPQDKSN